MPVVSEGRDAVKVARAALKRASKEGRDVLIVDTAGRLHTKDHLMAELSKVRRVIDRVEPNCAIENVPSHTSRAASDSPGPSWPKRKQTRRGSSIVSRWSDPGRLSMPITGSSPAHQTTSPEVDGVVGW